MECKICSTEFTGRSDKKFCSVKCKNLYHINLRKVSDIAVQEINKILHRNRSILLEIMGKHKSQIKVEHLVLDKKKFNYKYHTHFQVNPNGKPYFYVYDFGWTEISDNDILIVRKNKDGN